MNDCIDLEARFPDHDIGYEDSLCVSSRDVSNKIIKCKGGHISSDDKEYLLACTDNHCDPRTGKFRKSKWTRAIEECECCQVVQNGADGVNARFRISDAETVFALMGALLK